MTRLAATVCVVALASVWCLTLLAQPSRELFPHTTERGRAAVEYDDDQLQAVAAYYLSQQHHDSRWLLIELAVSARLATRISRDTIALMTPDDRVVPVASQAAFAGDAPRIRSLLLRAKTTRHGITGYFKRRQIRNFQFFVLPFQGVAYDVFDVDKWQVAWGDLFFASPTGAWAPGTYTLLVAGSGGAQAQLPIELE